MPEGPISESGGYGGEINAIDALMHEQREMLQKNDEEIEGFIIGMNCDEVAGQSVFYCHVHLIS